MKKQEQLDKRENLNLDKDGTRLWNLARAMNDEKPSVAPVILKENDKLLTGKHTADHLMKRFEAVSNQNVPKDREKDILGQQKQFMSEGSEEEAMTKIIRERTTRSPPSAERKITWT